MYAKTVHYRFFINLKARHIMKRMRNLIIAVAAVSFISCNNAGTDSRNLAAINFVTEKGASYNESEDNTISEFNTLTMKGVGNIYYEQADSTTLTIKGPLKLLDKIIIENRGKELYISFDPEFRNVRDTRNIYYYITSPQLNEVNIKGVTNFYSEKRWVAEELNLSVEGVGTINASNIDSKKLNVNMDGVGKIKIDVKCDEINTNIKGVGKIEIAGETGTINMNNKGIGKTDISGLTVRDR